MPERSPLLNFLRSGSLPTTAEAWSLFLAEARRSKVLPRIAMMLRTDATTDVPTAVQPHLESAWRLAEAMTRDVWRELQYVEEALSSIQERILLLKGAAYVVARLPAAVGRIFSDLDILVERTSLPAVESALLLGGWSSGRLTDYDRRYYREWSHEIPPLTHHKRGTVIDLHHSLVMPTCRIRVDSKKMIESAIPIPGTPWFRLNDEDLVLHAASHLLLNGDFEHGLRDLWDLVILLDHFSSMDEDFPQRVMVRAREVGLAALMRRAFSLCAARFQFTPPGRVGEGHDWLGFAFDAATSVRHPATRPRWQPLADTILLIRELYLRLPLPLLFTHLAHKAMLSLRGDQDRSVRAM